jgi:adenine deaminase
VNELYRVLALAAVGLIALAPASAAPASAANGNGKTMHDLVLRNGAIYDGSGQKPYVGDVAIDGDRISYVGVHRELAFFGRTEIDAPTARFSSRSKIRN